MDAIYFVKYWLSNNLYSPVNKIKQVLNKLITADQTGFLEGSFIGENARLIYDMEQYTEEQNISGLLLLFNLEKALDSISWPFIKKKS